MPDYEESLGDGLILRTVRDERDVERYAAFNKAVVGAAQGTTCERLLRHHPEMTYEDFLLVEDQHSGEVISTTCLIPWRCRYEDIELHVAQLEMVATHPDYRRRGLIRAQIRRFHERAAERGYDLCIIEGIPYYYRQFGYGYAVDHWASDSLPAWRVPDAPAGEESPCRLRAATVDDAPLLAQLYEQAMVGLQFHALHSVEYWRFLLQWAQFPVRIVEDQRDGRPVGYVCTTRLAGDRGIRVSESGIASAEVGLAVLRELKGEAGGEIQLGWPQEGTLVRLARSLGGGPLPAYQWLVRIVDVARFLDRIGPILGRRLAASAFAGLTDDICLNLFREAYTLRFAAGRLLGVEPAGFVDASMGAPGGHINLPPEAFVRLALGYRGLEELRDAWPDIVVRPESRLLVDALFPRMASYLCTPYMYCGPV